MAETNHTPQYSTPEVTNRALATLQALKDRLAEVGIMGAVSDNWYTYLIKSELKYTIVSAADTHEVIEVEGNNMGKTPEKVFTGKCTGKLRFCFTSIRNRLNGCLFEEVELAELDNQEELLNLLVATAQEQYRAYQEALKLLSEFERVNIERAKLREKVLEDFPEYAGVIRSSINRENQIRYSVDVCHLTEYQLRTLLTMIRNKTLPEEDPNGSQEKA